MVKPGDLILCRKTAPLVKHCIALIGQGVAARVRGRNVGKSLTDLARTVAKLDGFTPDAFPKYLSQYKGAQVAFLAQKEDSEEQVENLIDRCAALEASYHRYYSKDAGFDAILSQIEALFSDENPGIWLSTIHRAKGLESDRVMILEYDNLPLVWKNQQPYQYRQEENLVYVALTRSKKELVIFGAEPAKPIQPLLIAEPIVVDIPLPVLADKPLSRAERAIADMLIDALEAKKPAKRAFPGHSMTELQYLDFRRQCLLSRGNAEQLIAINARLRQMGHYAFNREMVMA
jgi:superfamily I DNA/RNA helicase